NMVYNVFLHFLLTPCSLGFGLPGFRSMILCTVPDSWPALDYADYGCYCGLGGSGTPVDELDRCCQVHDQCYSDAMQFSLTVYSKYFLNSIYSLNRLLCLSLLDDNDLCEKFICECDRNAAMCFAEAGYNEENADIPSDRCQ
uniref:Phospholipase A2 n=1 Tax=Oreochromis niloticus TaxID=8128 RepID=A0A669F3I7_ORENI